MARPNQIHKKIGMVWRSGSAVAENLCGINPWTSETVASTSDRDVTCKRCLKIMGNPAKRKRGLR